MNNETWNEAPIEEVPEEIAAEGLNRGLGSINMNDIVGTHHILFVCLDTLRYDVAMEAQENNETPYINSFGDWKKCHAPGNFTYPSHHAMFSGFFPVYYDDGLNRNNLLFFPKDIGLGRKPPENTFAFEGNNFIKGLEKEGYETICIGGVAFFNKRTEIGSVFPSMFKQSYWHPSFACSVKESPDNQINQAIKVINKLEHDEKIMMYVNIDAIHYPNYFYADGEKKDSVITHKAALKYVDNVLPKLFNAFKNKGDTFVILCSDHGSCYGEDGQTFHGFNHEIVNTVPYKHFILPGE